jgi:hypothetical protein
VTAEGDGTLGEVSRKTARSRVAAPLSGWPLPTRRKRGEREARHELLAEAVERPLPFIAILQDSKVAQFAQVMRGDGHARPEDMRDLADAQLLGGGERQEDLETLVIGEQGEHRTDSF